MRILSHQAHVWFVQPESIRDTAVLQYAREVLDTGERKQLERFIRREDAHRYLVSHLLVRRTLSKYLDIAPSEWVFTRAAHGRPEIANPNLPALRFNLTHTHGLSACIVTLSADCGVDAEFINANRHSTGIAGRMFSQTEVDRLQQLEGRDQVDYFFTLWTLREAYVKARGLGISFPMRKLTFTVENDRSIRVSFHPELADRSEDWQFQLLRPTPQHITAVAIRCDNTAEKKLISRFLDISSLSDSSKV